MHSKIVAGALAALALAALAFLIAYVGVPGLGTSSRNVPIPDVDPNHQVLVPIEHPMDAGKPLADAAWVDAATQGIRQDDLFIRLDTVKAGLLPEKGAARYLLINFRLTQNRAERTNTFNGFAGAAHRPVLTDSSGRSYAFLGHRSRKPFPSKLDPPFNFDHWLIFELPPSGVDSLKLEVPASAWGRQGICRFHIRSIEQDATPDEMPKQIAKYKAIVEAPNSVPPDPSLGRALFTKTCMECHTLFGVGAKIGPDLTDLRLTPGGPLKRRDVNFLVTNVVDPSAEIAKEFQPSVVTTTNGVVIVGIVKESNDTTITLQTSSKLIPLAKKDIEEIQLSKISLMPVDLLKSLSDHEVRSLISYVSGPGQVPLLANTENAVYFFTSKDLSFWQPSRAPWRLDAGELISPRPETGARAPLVSDLVVADDFHLTLQFHVGRERSGAVAIRDVEAAELSPAGLRAELAADAPVEVVAGDGTRLQRPGSSTAGTVKADAWNKLEIVVAGNRFQNVLLNGQEAIAAHDLPAPARAVISLEGPGATGREIRFRLLDLRVLPVTKRGEPMR